MTAAKARAKAKAKAKAKAAAEAKAAAKYEALVHRLFTALVEQLEDPLPPGAANYGPTNKHIGASGFSHQIDVSVQTETELHLIECKCWNDPVTAEAVLVIAARAY